METRQQRRQREEALSCEPMVCTLRRGHTALPRRANESTRSSSKVLPGNKDDSRKRRAADRKVLTRCPQVKGEAGQGEEELPMRFSQIYSDGKFMYSHVTLPPIAVERFGLTSGRLLTHPEWAAMGLCHLSPSWEHYMVHTKEPHILLFRRLVECSDENSHDEDCSATSSPPGMPTGLSTAALTSGTTVPTPGVVTRGSRILRPRVKVRS